MKINIIDRFKKINFLNPDYVKAQWFNYNQRIRARYETKEEIELWEKYRNIVEESFKKNNPKQKFSLTHVEELGIDYDILFLYSKKDVGKTWSAAKYIDRLLRKDPSAQVVFIRNSKEESKGFISTMNGSNNWPTWTNGEFVYKKEDLKKYKGVLSRCTPCGLFAYCSGAGFVKWQGGDWQNVKFWYWDECNSKKGGLTYEVFENLNVFLSSIIRDKSQVKGLMTGNLLEKSNIFLSRLGVGSKTRLKIFKVHKDNNPKNELLSTLLYLNTGDMFKGIEEQRGLATQFLTSEEFQKLISNRPGMYSTKIEYEEPDLITFIPAFAFVFTHKEAEGKEIDLALYAYRVPNSSRIVLWIEKFDPLYIKPKFKVIYCNDSLIANKYTMTMPITDKEDFADMFIQPISDTLFLGEVYFGWNGSEEVFNQFWPSMAKKYLSENSDGI